MTETPRDDKPKPARRPRIKLPFDNRREDMGSWTYDHRIGLCVTLIAYLALMIVFVSSKIVVGRRTHQQGMYSITDPVRTSRYLEVPAYLCEGGGDVTVSVTVDRAGKVTGARVTEGGDDCMRESALRAARNSLFNIDNSAPARQTGTITYIFIPQ